MKSIICLIFLLTTLKAFSADDYMYFGLSSLVMEKKSSDDFLSGDAFADRIYVMMSDNEFEISTTTNDNGIFKAGTYLTDDRIYFAKDGMKFSTTLEKTNPLFSLTRLEIQKAEVELAKESISIRGDLLDARFEDLGFVVKNIDMKCLTGGDFTTDVDIACMQNTKILPLEGFETGFVQLKDVTENREFLFDIDAKELTVASESLHIDAARISGNYKGGEYLLNEGSLNCFKYTDIDGLDVDRILNGCLKSSKILSKGFRFKKSGLNMEISKASIGMTDSVFTIGAAYASFLTGDGVTYVSNMKLECAKYITDADEVYAHLVLNGCLDRMLITIKNIENDDKDLTGLSQEEIEIEKKTRIKDIDFRINSNNFKLKAKIKFLLNIPMLLSGKVNLNNDSDELIIKVKKAKVAGIPTKKLALSLVKKFVDSAQVRVDGDRIIIKL